MAQNNFDLTGVLLLKQVTPVIQALFGGLNLNTSAATGIQDGQAYIAKTEGDSDPSWATIREALLELTKTLKLPLDPVAMEDESIEEILSALAEHFGSSGNVDLLNLLDHERTHFKEDAELEDLVTIAKALDDGHGLKGFLTEAAWTSSKPRLFEFGGCGAYVGVHVSVYTNSNTAGMVGRSLDKALETGNLEEAVQVVYKKVDELLDGIRDEAIRAQVKARLGQRLCA